MANQNRPVLNALLKRYPANEYVVMEEVSDAAGHSRTRSADFVIVNYWLSRGLAIEGVELKSHRSDWLRELKMPEKAAPIMQYCDKFWLLTTDQSVAKMEEIPINWGWMCIKGNSIRVMKPAPKLEAKPVTKSFTISMLKRAADKTGYVHRSEIESHIEKSAELAVAHAKLDAVRMEQEHKSMKAAIQRFELASGIPFFDVDIRYEGVGNIRRSWNGLPAEEIGKVIKLLSEGAAGGELKARKEEMEQLLKKSEIIYAKMKEAFSIFESTFNQNQDEINNS
jgi:hypothetical protein